MTESVDVLVAGGGVVGLTAALAMARRQYRVALLDARELKPSEAPDLRVYAVNQASEQLFKALGVWNNIQQSRHSPYEAMLVWEAKGAAIDFNSRLVGADKLGTIIEEAVIKNALLKALQQLPNVQCDPVTEIIALEPLPDKILIQSKAKSWESQLLIVADGAESPCRKLLKVDIHNWPYHQHALVASVQTELAHQKTAYQIFNGDGPLAFLPLNTPQQCSIVWSTTPARARQLKELPEAEFNQQLTAAFQNKLGQVEVISPRFQFPLHMRHVKQYAGAHWMLTGDAAHTIHPLAGLGLNVGLQDIAEWIAIVDRSGKKAFSKTMLAEYQRARKASVWQTILLMQALKSGFANPLPPLRLLREFGLKFCNQLTPLKRLFIEHANGK
ncbi:2-polyprenyl-6-methoxyphenol hydroxylase [Legionella quinlivanii]|uniref:2-polyprenyl-6-methoxyphenol hydroxylase n=1 Tax=Legionella quinlivanii TaxID=45073 RepID=A0A0W0Y5X3_9GAMM|nr:FAD-dependent oxidoreductase [Legionella quinlivanii]KTD52070.1 2-polyprenyl-6-methoxyphenol hydroxylase [Legionella quinlivanii]MCW8452334.1 FAD-dependent monooxygenase [Legionella quinlivanii]SEF89221.1 2-octaprenylphenol hydroxylase [Legionella quinlivanii DSM 21216]STY12434.1 2-polyprenyl-6-methoxyphenol hydroxylase [Legionella quinlivanii]